MEVIFGFIVFLNNKRLAKNRVAMSVDNQDMHNTFSDFMAAI